MGIIPPLPWTPNTGQKNANTWLTNANKTSKKQDCLAIDLLTLHTLIVGDFTVKDVKGISI